MVVQEAAVGDDGLQEDVVRHGDEEEGGAVEGDGTGAGGGVEVFSKDCGGEGDEGDDEQEKTIGEEEGFVDAADPVHQVVMGVPHAEHDEEAEDHGQQRGPELHERQ